MVMSDSGRALEEGNVCIFHADPVLCQHIILVLAFACRTSEGAKQRVFDARTGGRRYQLVAFYFSKPTYPLACRQLALCVYSIKFPSFRSAFQNSPKPFCLIC